MLDVVCQAKTQQAVASALGVSRQAVATWLSGAKLPGEERRIVIEDAFGVPRDAWLRRPEIPVEAASATAVRSRPEGGTAYDRACEHVDDCDAAIARFPGASPRELSALLNARSTALRALTACEPNWKKILECEEWRRIEDAIAEVLKPHPEIATALADAMVALERDFRGEQPVRVHHANEDAA